MLRPTLLTLLFFLTCQLLGQNLIPNPGFEDVNTCFKYHEKCSPKAWRSTVLKNFAYREYLGESALPQARKRQSVRPPEGSRYAALRLFNQKKKSDRTFIQVPLLCELEAGQSYTLSFQYYAAYYKIEDFGIAFVDTLKIHDDNEPLYHVEPQIKMESDPKMESRKWYTASSTFTASGKEIGMIIGNFNTDNNTQLTELRVHKKDKPPLSVYYAIDDFSLTRNDNEDIKESCPIEKHRSFIYQDTIRHIISESIKTIADLPPVIEPIKSAPKVDTIDIQSIPQKAKEPIVISGQNIDSDKAFVFDDIQFQNNKAILQVSAFRPLEELTKFLKKNATVNLHITGHTDNIGKDTTNQLLSEQRAKVVADFLINNGIRPERLSTFGKGESQPLVPNDTVDGRQKNRRVTFKIQ